MLAQPVIPANLEADGGVYKLVQTLGNLKDLRSELRVKQGCRMSTYPTIQTPE